MDKFNPVESIEEERKEPKKPIVLTDFDKEKARIEKDLEKEYTFMLNLMYMAREEGLTNEPRELFLMYKSQKEKARMGVVWAKGDEDAEKVI
jgi:hypothetical protein